MTGYFINCISPAIEKMIINRKRQAYETVVDKIHSGEQISKYADMTGGAKGHEDVAFSNIPLVRMKKLTIRFT